MTDKNDYKDIAEYHIGNAEFDVAQVFATLYLGEQQRIDNLIAYQHNLTEIAAKASPNNSEALVLIGTLGDAIREGLGI